MRIISGIFRGKKLIQPSDNKTRPLKDLAKESIFNIIHHSNKLSVKIENSLILDLFSGVGSFGIECLSRGARFVTFVENYKEVLLILNKNLKNLKLINNYEILEKDILNNFEFNSFKKKFDIIFLDPPYKEKNIFEIINKIINQNLLSKNGLIIIHRHKNEIDKLPEKLKIVEEKKYGIAKIIFAKI